MKLDKLGIKLDTIIGHVESAREILRKANAEATATESIVLLPLIEDAERLRQKVFQLHNARSSPRRG